MCTVVKRQTGYGYCIKRSRVCRYTRMPKLKREWNKVTKRQLNCALFIVKIKKKAANVSDRLEKMSFVQWLEWKKTCILCLFPNTESSMLVCSLRKKAVTDWTRNQFGCGSDVAFTKPFSIKAIFYLFSCFCCFLSLENWNQTKVYGTVQFWPKLLTILRLTWTEMNLSARWLCDCDIRWLLCYSVCGFIDDGSLKYFG